MALRWTGAPGGTSWKRRPLRLAFCTNCIFRPIVLRKLEQAGIDWEMAVLSEDDRAVEALVSADLAVGALLEDSIPPHQEAIEPGSALPDLGVQKINLYARPEATRLLDPLSDMLRQGFVAQPAPVSLWADGVTTTFPVERRLRSNSSASSARSSGSTWLTCGPESPLLVPPQECAQAVGHHLGPEVQIAPPVEAHHAQVLDQQMIGRNLRHLAAGKADGQNRASGLQARIAALN